MSDIQPPEEFVSMVRRAECYVERYRGRVRTRVETLLARSLRFDVEAIVPFIYSVLVKVAMIWWMSGLPFIS